MKRIIPIALLALLILSCDSSTLMAAVYPRNYGLLDARTGVERFRALYNAHIDALKRNEQVDYSGIKELEIEIPKDAESIPLGRTTDFKGLVLTVRNTTKDFYLFSLANATKEVSVPQSIIDGHSFTGIKELSSGTNLLIVEDKTPWVKERKGYNHAVYRKDIFLIKDGIAQNNTVMPYGVDTKSQPVCRYADVDARQKKVSNLTFKRTSDSSYKTCLLQIDGQNNVLLKNLNTVTPANENLNGDHIIYITNSANITYKNINIEGVYCPKDSWGYGVSMDNVYNVKCYNVTGSGTVFGSNNINTSSLKDCSLSRYDIHCYGRDVKMANCTFWGSGFRTSSFYGDLVYKRCTLKYYLPVSIRNEYSCNVPYNLVMKNCTYYMSDQYNYVIYTGNTNYQTARRKELEEKCLPNVKIDGLTIIPDEDVKVTYLFLVGHHDADARFDYLSDINVKNVVVQGNQDFKICTSPFEVKNEAEVTFRKKGGDGIKMRTNKISITER